MTQQALHLRFYIHPVQKISKGYGCGNTTTISSFRTGNLHIVDTIISLSTMKYSYLLFITFTSEEYVYMKATPSSVVDITIVGYWHCMG